MATFQSCGACGGTGQVFEGDHWVDENCRTCHGTGTVRVTAKAKKDYECILCRQTITAGTEYVPMVITPWTCAPDCDPGFARHHMHQECATIWYAVCHLFDYQLPPDTDCWRQMVEAYTEQLKTPEGTSLPPGLVHIETAF